MFLTMVYKQSKVNIFVYFNIPGCRTLDWHHIIKTIKESNVELGWVRVLEEFNFVY